MFKELVLPYRALYLTETDPATSSYYLLLSEQEVPSLPGEKLAITARVAMVTTQ